MQFPSIQRRRLALSATIAVLMVGIAVADWKVEANAPVGFLYLLPIALAGTLLSRWQIVLLTSVCTLLAELYDCFPWNAAVGIPRDFLYFSAFCGVGLFVPDVGDNRRRSSIHMNDLETQVQPRKDAEGQLNRLIHTIPVA